jgi:hypothetical protein
MVIDGPLWFFGAVIVCGAHVLYLRSWRREQIARLAWWQRYDADARKRHDEFMRATDRGWSLDGNRDRGQA